MSQAYPPSASSLLCLSFASPLVLLFLFLLLAVSVSQDRNHFFYGSKCYFFSSIFGAFGSGRRIILVLSNLQSVPSTSPWISFFFLFLGAVLRVTRFSLSSLPNSGFPLFIFPFRIWVYSPWNFHYFLRFLGLGNSWRRRGCKDRK